MAFDPADPGKIYKDLSPDEVRPKIKELEKQLGSMRETYERLIESGTSPDSLKVLQNEINNTQIEIGQGYYLLTIFEAYTPPPTASTTPPPPSTTTTTPPPPSTTTTTPPITTPTSPLGPRAQQIQEVIDYCEEHFRGINGDLAEAKLQDIDSLIQRGHDTEFNSDVYDYVARNWDNLEIKGFKPDYLHPQHGEATQEDTAKKPIMIRMRQWMKQHPVKTALIGVLMVAVGRSACSPEGAINNTIAPCTPSENAALEIGTQAGEQYGDLNTAQIEANKTIAQQAQHCSPAQFVTRTNAAAEGARIAIETGKGRKGNVPSSIAPDTTVAVSPTTVEDNPTTTVEREQIATCDNGKVTKVDLNGVHTQSVYPGDDCTTGPGQEETFVIDGVNVHYKGVAR